MSSQAATSTAESVPSQEDKTQGAHLPGFSSPAPPFFANPFMAPFLPQQLNNAAPGSVIAGSGVSSPTTSPPPVTAMPQQSPFPGLDGTEFRMNPLTGGYFLAPSQYQEMMQQYMQSLMVAAATQQRQLHPAAGGVPFDVSGFPTSQGVDPSAALSAFTGLSMCQSAQPVPYTTSQSSTPSKLSSTSSAGVASSPSPPVAAVQSVRLTELEHAFCATEPSVGTSAQETADLANNLTMTSDGAPATSRQSETANAEDRTATDDEQPIVNSEGRKTEDAEECKSPNPSGSSGADSSAAHRDANDDESASTSATETLVRPVEVSGVEAGASPESDSTATKEPTDDSSSSTSAAQKNSAQDQRTAELIKKQMSEIEKEINRRIQNKNVKKIDETELAQLLNDHGFGSFVDAAANPELAANFSVAADQAGLPYRAPSEPFSSASPAKPSLNQLRSSFSPPEPPTTIAPQLNGYLPTVAPTAAQNGTSMMPQAFNTTPSFPYGHQPSPQTHSAETNPAQMGYAMQAQLPGSFYSAPQMPQQQQPHVMPPVSTITPEMAAALLQQLQQQNPSLLQSLVGAQVPTSQSTNGSSHHEASSKAASTIPAPPPPAVNVARRPPGGRHHVTANRTASSASTNSWALGNDDAVWNDLTKRHGSVSSASSNEPSGSHHANGVNDDKENHQQEPVWQMRDSYLKRLQRDEMRSRELHEQENGLLGAERLNCADEEEEETDKLLRRDHNETVEEAIKSKKNPNKKEVMVHEPAVLIEGVLFRARYLGSTQMACDGRATKTSRMGQAQEAVARVKAPEGEIQPSTEIDLFISTEKIMVLNTDLQRISETDVRQDILMDHALRSISYIADIGDLVVLMARRVPQSNGDDDDAEGIRKAPKVVCHVFESDEAAFIAQSIGQAFQVAYVEFLRANGIDDPAYLREIDYQEVLNAQELLGEELELFARKETQKDIVIRKKVGEALGVVVVESGWGSMLPTVVVANMAPGGAASRSNELNIGDQIIGINGISLVGLPLAAAQQNIKNAKSSTAVRLTVVHTPPVVEVRIKRPDTKYQLGFSVQNGVICSLLRGGIAERGGIRVGHRIIEINHQSVVAVPHEKIVNMLATATGEIHMKTMPTSMFRLLTGQEIPNYI